MKRFFMLGQAAALSLTLSGAMTAAAAPGDGVADTPQASQASSARVLATPTSAGSAAVGALFITAGPATALVPPPAAPVAAPSVAASPAPAAPAAPTAPAAPAAPSAAAPSASTATPAALPAIAAPPAPPPLFVRQPIVAPRSGEAPAPWTVDVLANLRQPALTGNALFLVYDAQDPGALSTHEVMTLLQASVTAGSRIAARLALSPEDGFRTGRYLIQVAQIVGGKEVVLAEGELRLQ